MDCSYSTLKQTKKATNGATTLKNRSSSITQARYDREFNTSATVQHGAAANATTLINNLTKESDQPEEDLKALLNEALPGSCKSLFALNIKIRTDKNNANFAMRKQPTEVPKNR